MITFEEHKIPCEYSRMTGKKSKRVKGVKSENKSVYPFAIDFVVDEDGNFLNPRLPNRKRHTDELIILQKQNQDAALADADKPHHVNYRSSKSKISITADVLKVHDHHYDSSVEYTKEWRKNNNKKMKQMRQVKLVEKGNVMNEFEKSMGDTATSLIKFTLDELARYRQIHAKYRKRIKSLHDEILSIDELTMEESISSLYFHGIS